MSEATLYERLGGAFAIAAVVDHFSDALIGNPVVGQNSDNPALREWHTNNLARLPGLKFMRTLWVCDISGGPQTYAATEPGRTALGLEDQVTVLLQSPPGVQRHADPNHEQRQRDRDQISLPGRSVRYLTG